MESIQLDRVLRSPGLDVAVHPTPSEARPERPESTQRGPNRATSEDRVDLRASQASESAVPADPQAKDDADQLEQAVKALAENVHGLSEHSLEIRYNEENSRFVVKILDTDTGEVIRELPPEQLLDAATRIDEVRGLIFDEKS